jgi:hypothetical protein
VRGVAKDPEDMVVRLLRDIQSGIASQGKDICAIQDDLRRQRVKIDELTKRVQRLEKHK